MDISKICRDYLSFNGFSDIYSGNDLKTKAIGAVKVLSYFTIVLPVLAGITYMAAELYGRVKKKETLNEQDQRINDLTQRRINNKPKEKEDNQSVDAPKSISKTQTDFVLDPMIFIYDQKMPKTAQETFQNLGAEIIQEDTDLCFAALTTRGKNKDVITIEGSKLLTTFNFFEQRSYRSIYLGVLLNQLVLTDRIGSWAQGKERSFVINLKPEGNLKSQETVGKEWNKDSLKQVYEVHQAEEAKMKEEAERKAKSQIQ